MLLRAYCALRSPVSAAARRAIALSSVLPAYRPADQSWKRLIAYSARSEAKMSGGATEHKYTNRLAEEQSPYLLQHAHNPVDWLPWGQEAFEKARREDKPIFLSVGYSTCHWCHVMERESFESEEIAEVINEHFVPVKVDREERPDVDKVYMTYVQATSGGGGWPMSVFLTPDLEPVFGGTYFPPKDMYGRPGFKTVLSRIAEVWRDRKEDVRAQGAEVMRQLAEMSAPEPSAEALSVAAQGAAIDLCVSQLAARFDPRNGGFGGAPKFPRPSEVNVLLHQRSRLVAAGDEAGARKVLGMALFSLQKMAAGGMHDHLGGGFHRYSVDEFWHVPHFEIMAYDEPQLVSTYLSAFQLTTGDEGRRLAWVARGVLDYMLRDMRHPEGGFFAAEDADSLDPASGQKKEGWFYVWRADEVASVLGEERARIFSAHYYVKPEGNCDLSPRSDPHGEFQGHNVLIERQELAQTAHLASKSEAETEALLAECREQLFKVRARRPRPHRDEKVVAAWNGMAISAFAQASRALANEAPPPGRLFPSEGRPPGEYLAAALAAAEFVRAKLYDEETGKLRRAFTRGPSDVDGFSDDYAHVIAGLLDLHAVTGNHKHLDWAMQLQAKQDELFWDNVGGAYFQSAAGDNSIAFRQKEDYDGAEPAASSIALANLWRLAGLSGTEAARELQKKAQKCASAFEGQLKQAALALPQLCCSLHLLTTGHPRQVIIAGRKGAEDTEALVNAAFGPFAPDKVVMQLDLSNEDSMRWWLAHNPEAVAMVEATGMEPGDPATAFICQNFTCQAPTTSPDKVKEVLARPRAGGPVPKPAPMPGGIRLPGL